MIPPHETYIETHLGSGAVMRNKSPVACSFGIDMDERVIGAFPVLPGLTLVHGDALVFLQEYAFTGAEVIYCDPPYLPSTRRRRRVYAHDYTRHDHEALLECLVSINARVVLSGYPSTLYDRRLSSWSAISVDGVSQTGRREERLWLNFEPTSLSDYRYLGVNFRDRERLRRRSRRWVDRLRRLPALERQAILSDLLKLVDGDPLLRGLVISQRPGSQDAQRKDFE